MAIIAHLRIKQLQVCNNFPACCTHRKLFPGVGKHGRALYIDTKTAGTVEYGTCKTRFQFLGTISEIGFGSPDMGGVGHRVFTAFRKAEYAVGKVFLFFVT